jgi:hypothetical protein
MSYYTEYKSVTVDKPVNNYKSLNKFYLQEPVYPSQTFRSKPVDIE